jgi:hypothetical protein
VLSFYENSILGEMVIGCDISLSVGKEGVVVVEAGVLVLSHELLHYLLSEVVVLV